MKQHITLLQYQELDDDKKIKWARIIHEQMSDQYDEDDNDHYELLEFFNYLDTLKNTDISQMIRFLFEKSDIDSPKLYDVLDTTTTKDNLCDSLWETVKKEL